jgi:FRG domain
MNIEDFEPIEINEFSDIEKKWLDRNGSSSLKWIYRGQRNSLWTLKSSLQRLCESMKIDLGYACLVEKSLTSEFKRRFHQYSTYDPNPRDNLEWLSIMQHHFAPTRLLDWTYSVYIALYFAIEYDSDEEDCPVVWCLDAEWANKETEKMLRGDNRFGSAERNNKDVDENWNLTSYGQNTDFIKKRFLLNFTTTAFPVNPSRITQRITAQKGVFLCPGNPNISFDKNIKEMTNYRNYIKRLVIPKNKRHDYLKRLYNLNINHAVLFPGLDGFAHSLSVYHHSFETIKNKDNPYIKDSSAWNK